MPTYLERYRNGEQAQVWAELTALGEQVRREPVLSDALAVARETMSRVRENAERIVSRLQTIKYDFDNSQVAFVGRQPPADDVNDQIVEMEAQAGPLPLSLRAWYEVGGAVDLIGFNARWPKVYTDPLVIDPIEAAFEILSEWQGDLADGIEDAGPFCIPVGPEYVHKGGYSGGAAYQIKMPCPAADAPLLYEWHDTTFVDYLRECFRWGGFPGFDISHPMNPQHLNADAVMPAEHRALLTADLLAF